MSSFELDKLKKSAMRSKVTNDDVKTALKSLENKRNQLFSSREIDFDTSMKMGKVIHAVYNMLEEENLNAKLDSIVSASGTFSLAPFYILDDTIRGQQWVDIIQVLHDLRFNLNTLFEKPLPSVKISTESDPEKNTKPIDNMLFSYTPFRLRGTTGNYTILLLPSTRKHNISTKWCDDDALAFYDDNIKVLTPNSVKLTNVGTLNNIVSIEGEHGFRLEIDRRSPSVTYYCKQGWYISPSSTCNKKDCPLWDSCQGRRFWKGPLSFYSIGRVSPEIIVKIDRHENPHVIQSNKFGLAVESINTLQAKIYIKSVNFYSSNFNDKPQIVLQEAPGYKITTKAVSFSLDAKFIEKFVENLLTNNKEIFAWVFTKYFISSHYEVNDLRKVISFFWNAISGINDSNVNLYESMIQAQSITPDLVKYGISLLIHSLSHLIREEVISLLQTSPQNLVYSYTENPESDGKYRIFIIENAESGLGLTQSFTASVERQGSKYLDNFANTINQILAMDGRTSLDFTPASNVDPNVTLIWNRVNEYNRIFQQRFGISVPVEYLRYILSHYDNSTNTIINRDEISPYVDDILSATPLCWDGCYHCVRLETGCHSAPYEQLFDVSRSLVTALVNEWRGVFDEEIKEEHTKPEIEIGKGRNLINYIKKAKNNVEIICPWFSKEVAKSLLDFMKEKGIKFKILTSDDQNNKTHVEALKIFTSEVGNQLEFKVMTDKLPHIKMIIIDDSLLIIGSANLTLSGLYGNLEGYVILSDREAIEKSQKSFEKFWNKAEIKNTS